VRVPGVEMIDSDPVEPRPEVLLHLPHHVAGEGAQVREPVAVLRGDDEAELVAVLPAALRERVAIRNVRPCAVKPAALAIAGRAIALQVTDMGVGRPAAGLQAHDPGLDHDTARPPARPSLGGGSLEPIGHGLAPADAGAPPLPGTALPASRPSLPSHLSRRERAAVRLGRHGHDLGHEGQRPAACSGAPVADAAWSWPEVGCLVAGHVRHEAQHSPPLKPKLPRPLLQR